MPERSPKNPEYVVQWEEGLWKGPGNLPRAWTPRNLQDMNKSVILSPWVSL